jgi:TolA-binding protein
MRGLIRISLAATVTLMSGCMLFTTKREGDKLRQEVGKLSRQVETMQKEQKAFLAKLTKAHAQLAELTSILPKARSILLRSSARFGVRLEQLATDVGKIKGRFENLSADQAEAAKKQKQLQTQLATATETLERVKTELTRLIVEVRKARVAPKTAAEFWAQATQARLAGRLPEARRYYQTLIKRFPRDPRAEAASYWTAKTYFDAYDFRNAVVAAARTLKAHPKGRFDARTRLLSARSYFELKRCRIAMRIVARLIRLHPNAAVAPQAKALLARLKRIQHMARFCRR